MRCSGQLHKVEECLRFDNLALIYAYRFVSTKIRITWRALCHSIFLQENTHQDAAGIYGLVALSIIAQNDQKATRVVHSTAPFSSNCLTTRAKSSSGTAPVTTALVYSIVSRCSSLNRLLVFQEGSASSMAALMPAASAMCTRDWNE